MKNGSKNISLIIGSDHVRFEQDRKKRAERQLYYQSLTTDKLDAMTEEQFYEFMAKLWAMLIWPTKSMWWIN